MQQDYVPITDKGGEDKLRILAGPRNVIGGENLVARAIRPNREAMAELARGQRRRRGL